MSTASATAEILDEPTLSQDEIKSILDRPAASIGPDDARAYLDALDAEDERIRARLIPALTGATAAIHLVIGGKLFILNGAGYIALLAARSLLPKNEAWQRYSRDGLIGYTGLTVGAFFVQNGAGSFGNIVGLGTKLVELALLRTLWAERKAARRKLERLAKKADATG